MDGSSIEVKCLSYILIESRMGIDHTFPLVEDVSPQGVDQL